MVEFIQWCFGDWWRWCGATVWLTVLAGAVTSVAYMIGNHRFFTFTYHRHTHKEQPRANPD